MRDVDIGYLAGIIEGEGSIYFCTKLKRPRIRISNTNIEILNKCIQILRDFGIDAKLRQQRQGNEKWKIGYSVDIDKLKDLEKILIIIKPELSGKKKQADVALNYFNKKISVEEATLLTKELNKKGR